MTILQNAPSNTTVDRTTWLRRVVQIDAGLFVLLGLVLLFDARSIANFLGIANPGVIVALGLGALAYDGARLVWASTGHTFDRRVAQLSLIANAAWAVVSALLLALDLFARPTNLWWTVALVADVVAIFAILQWIGLRRSAR